MLRQNPKRESLEKAESQCWNLPFESSEQHFESAFKQSPLTQFKFSLPTDSPKIILHILALLN